MFRNHPKITHSPVHPERPDLREKYLCKCLINNNLIEDLVNKIFEQIFVGKTPEDHPRRSGQADLRRTLINTGFQAIKAPKIWSGCVYRAYVIFGKPEIDTSFPEIELPIRQKVHKFSVTFD